MKRSDFLRLMGLAGASLYAAPFQSVAQTLVQPSVGEDLKGEYEVNAHFVHSGPGFGHRIALTFDDGPTPGVTEIVLAELAKRNLKATFFMIGNKVLMYPDLARAVVEAGHEVANHTFTHPTLSKLSAERVDSELQKCQEAIITTTGKTPVWFRPPYGAFRKEQGTIPRSKDLGVTYWSVDPQDWAQPGVAKIASRILSTARPGSIILMHDLHKQTALAVPAIFDGLLEKDFNMTRLTGFLGNPYPAGEVV